MPSFRDGGVSTPSGWTFFLQNSDASKAKARKYAEEFKGTITLSEFKSVRADIGIC